MTAKADKILLITVGGREISLDEQGFLVDPEQWNEEVAKFLAEQEGVELTDTHWDILSFMRDFLDEHGIAADARFAIRRLAKLELSDEKAARKHLFELFPYGYVKQACKIAGMRQPRAWSTG